MFADSITDINENGRRQVKTRKQVKMGENRGGGGGREAISQRDWLMRDDH